MLHDFIKGHRQESAGHNRSRGKGRPVEEVAWQEVAILPKQNPLPHPLQPPILSFISQTSSPFRVTSLGDTRMKKRMFLLSISYSSQGSACEL